mmetsp:Transcript_5830/g.16416  ORF Transcript_5830/g.16416 Transcript_5830/m.16416 type:complete len:227 (-) Transcript_5830:2216-2896(-)
MASGAMDVPWTSNRQSRAFSGRLAKTNNSARASTCSVGMRSATFEASYNGGSWVPQVLITVNKAAPFFAESRVRTSSYTSGASFFLVGRSKANESNWSWSSNVEIHSVKGRNLWQTLAAFSGELVSKCSTCWDATFCTSCLPNIVEDATLKAFAVSPFSKQTSTRSSPSLTLHVTTASPYRYSVGGVPSSFDPSVRHCSRDQFSADVDTKWSHGTGNVSALSTSPE